MMFFIVYEDFSLFTCEYSRLVTMPQAAGSDEAIALSETCLV